MIGRARVKSNVISKIIIIFVTWEFVVFTTHVKFYCDKKRSVRLTGIITTLYIKACKTTPIRNSHCNNDINFNSKKTIFPTFLLIIWAMRKLTMVTDEELVVKRMKRRLAKLSGVQTMCLEARAPCVHMYIHNMYMY